MIAGAPERMRLDHALIAARVFALAIDVVRASADGSAPTRREVQLVVSRRFAQLKENLRLSINVITTHMRANQEAHGSVAVTKPQ